MSHSAFIIDPHYGAGGYGEDRTTEFARLCSEQFGWQIRRMPPLDQTTDIAAWLQRLNECVDTSDIYICLGNFYILRMAGADRLGDLVDRMLTRIRGGVPILAEVRPEDVEGASNLGGDQIPRLIRSFEMRPTALKLASSAHEYEGHSSTINCWFRKTDDCLRDPVLFRGIDRVAIAAPFLLNYDGDAVPIIDAGPDHYFVNRGDLIDLPPPGVRPAVAAVRRTDNELQLVISGSALRDPTETLGGVLPNIHDNAVFAERVVQMLHEHGARKSRLRGDAYELFFQIERALGSVVQKVLAPELSQDWLKRAPDWVRKELENGRGAEWGRATFKHLAAIIYDDWLSFARAFAGTSRDDFRALFYGINAEERRYLAHPHRSHVEGTEFGPEALERLRKALSIARAALAK